MIDPEPSSVLNNSTTDNLGAVPRSTNSGSGGGTGMAGSVNGSLSASVHGATSSDLQCLASYFGVSIELIDQLRMADLDEAHAKDTKISWPDKLTQRRALEHVLKAKDQDHTVIKVDNGGSVNISKLISRAKEAGKVTGGLYIGSKDPRSIAVFLDEIDSMDEYSCGSDIFKYFYIRSNLDEDVSGYINKEVKVQIKKKGVSSQDWERKLSILRSALLEEYTVLSSDLAIQLEWDKFTYVTGSSRMESHLTKLLTLADRVALSRGSPVLDRELRSKLYASLPSAAQRWIDSLGSSAVANYAAMRKEVRRWAQYNETPVGSARRTTSVSRGGKRVQVSVADTNAYDDEESIDEAALSLALGDIDKDACWRCAMKGHRAFECRSKIYEPQQRCSRCGSYDHLLAQCLHSSATLLCGRCKQPGHYSAACSAPVPVARFNSRGGRGPRKPTTAMAAIDGDTGGTSSSPPPVRPDTGSSDSSSCTAVLVIQVDLMTMSTTPIAECPLEVDIVPPAELQAEVAGRPVRLLVDSGAGLNFISESLAGELALLCNRPFQPLLRALKVVFGNDEQASVSRGIQLPLTVNRRGNKECILVSFVILPSLNPSVLLGRPGIYELGLSVHGPPKAASLTEEVAALSISPIEVVYIPDKGDRLVAHCPRLEDSKPELHVEPQRRRPDRERKAIYKLLCLMEKEDKVTRLQAGEAWTINEVVLVAKKGADSWKVLPNILEEDDAEKLLANFRVTLDLRFVNKIGTSAPTLKQDEKSKLSQYGVNDLIGSLPLSHGAYFGRIDLRDAFHGVYISPDMQKHMATRVLDDDGNEVLFAWKRLPMGYKQSSGLFGRAVETMVIDARSALKEANLDCSLRSLQDDVIVAGPDEETVNLALTTLINVVRKYGFECRDSKVQKATNKLVFCGHLISGRQGGVPLLTPAPQRRDLSSAAFEAEWELFEKKCKSPSSKLKFLRKWTGVFQWFSHWLEDKQQDALRSLNGTVKKLQNNECIDDADWSDVSGAWHSLAQSYMEGLTPLYLGHCAATIVATDSNVESWYGVLLGVVLVNASTAGPSLFPELEERLYEIGPGDDILPVPESGKVYKVMPVRLCGGIWKKREQLRSSTWRERGAQLMCVADNLDALRGARIISLNDNANLCKTWRDVQGDFGYSAEPYAGVWIKRWELFEAYVDRCVWVPREVDALKWVDLAARKLTVQESDNEVEVLAVEVPQTGLDMDSSIKKEVNDIMHHYTVPSEKSMSLLASFSGTDNYKDALGWLSTQQKNDEQLNKVREACHEDRKEAREFCVEEDCLFHKGRWRADKPVIKQAVLPNYGELRMTIMNEFHEFSIHGSAQLLCGMVQQAYWWPSVRKDCKAFVRQCAICQRSTKTASDICVPRSGQRLQVPLPWYAVGSDVFMLGRELEAEFNLHWSAMLTITCAYTGFTVLVPLSEPVDSSCIINAYLYAFSLYGYPRYLRCDGGANLVSQEVASWLLAHGINNTIAVGYSPWTGGYYERRHKDLAATLRKFLLDLKYGTGAFYVNSPYALAAMLQGQLNSFGLDWYGCSDTTPQMLMTGTLPRPPSSLDQVIPRDKWSSQGMFGAINLKEASGENIAMEESRIAEVLYKRASDIRKRRDECLRDFNVIWLEKREEARNQFDQTLTRKQTKETLKVGDKVLLAIRSPSKLMPKWSEPYEVAALRGLRCIVKSNDGVLKEVHLRYVKKFYDQTDQLNSKRGRVQEVEETSEVPEGDVEDADSVQERRRPARKCAKMTSYAHQL